MSRAVADTAPDTQSRGRAWMEENVPGPHVLAKDTLRRQRGVSHTPGGLRAREAQSDGASRPRRAGTGT